MFAILKGSTVFKGVAVCQYSDQKDNSNFSNFLPIHIMEEDKEGENMFYLPYLLAFAKIAISKLHPVASYGAVSQWIWDPFLLVCLVDLCIPKPLPQTLASLTEHMNYILVKVSAPNL